MVSLMSVLNYAIINDISDVHLAVGENPFFRKNGKLVREVEQFGVLEDVDMKVYCETLIKSKEKIDKLNEGEEIDVPFEMSDGKRFRVNVFKQSGKIGIVLRLIKSKPPTLEELNLPDIIKQLLKYKQGLILVTGPTGSGKSTTLGAMVDYLNVNNHYHIITLEDPIEFVHENKLSLINQREIGTDSKSYSNALNAALRQDPDVVLLGEMRGDSVETALKASETGHLVLSTLHTNDAPSTIDRIIDSFPSDQQDQIRVQLSESLVGVISQRLIPRADGNGRVAAFEIMVNNHAIRNLIRKSKTFQIKNTINMSRAQGMISIEKNVEELYTNGVISKDEFDSYSNNTTI